MSEAAHAAPVTVRELSVWGFDDYPYRPAEYNKTTSDAAQDASTYVPQRATLPVPAELAEALAEQRQRPDLRYEMRGLQWETGVVELGALLAFQRRLSFDPGVPRPTVPIAGDWHALMEFCFAPATEPSYVLSAPMRNVHVAASSSPNLQLRTDTLALYNGSPFVEVAEYRGRWFLRDGYHRAYGLLRAGISHMPAVIVQARTLAELGATKPWFFGEEVLFSDRPPRVTDFLKERCTIEYQRPRLLRQLRVTVEESFVPATGEGEAT